MDKSNYTIAFAVSLILKAVIVAAQFSGRIRKRSLKRLADMDIDTKDKEILFLKDKVYQLQMQVSILQNRVKKRQRKARYTLRERLFILWHMETFQIPRRKVTEYIGVSRSTLYRWLHKIIDDEHTHIPTNKTPKEIAALIWEITKSNINWGRVRIANQLALLNIFISASTVRNILKSQHHIRLLHQQLSKKTPMKKTRPDQLLPGIPIMSGLLTLQWFFAGDFGLYMYLL